MLGGQLPRQFQQQQPVQRNNKLIPRPEELKKQWKDISTAQKSLLHVQSTRNPWINDTANQILSQTFDSSNNLVPIYRTDILQLLDERADYPITIEPVEKYIFMICRYSNQYYGNNPLDPPYSAALYSEFLHFIEQERYKEASQLLVNTGIQFFKTKFIFIPFVLGVHNIARPGLLVISPLYRTVDILDPSSSSISSSGFPNDSIPNLLSKILKLVFVHVGGRFNPLEWRVRWTAASQQVLDINTSYIAIMANAMSIAFSYEIHNWLDISLNTSDHFSTAIREPELNFLISSKPYEHKARRAALELLHGRFEVFDQTSDDNDESGTFAYRLGGSDYVNPDPVYRFVGGQLVELRPGFTRLPDLRSLYFAVLGKGPVPQVGFMADDDLGSHREDRGFKRMLVVRNTCKCYTTEAVKENPRL